MRPIALGVHWRLSCHWQQHGTKGSLPFSWERKTKTRREEKGGNGGNGGTRRLGKKRREEEKDDEAEGARCDACSDCFFLSFSPLFPFLYSFFPLLPSSSSSLSMLFIHWTSSQNECARPPGKEEADERVEQVQVPPPYTYTVVRSTAMKRIAMTSII